MTAVVGLLNIYWPINTLRGLHVGGCWRGGSGREGEGGRRERKGEGDGGGDLGRDGEVESNGNN